MSDDGDHKLDRTQGWDLADSPFAEPAPLCDSWVGRVVADRFEVQEFVASGGMGAVYRARQVGLERSVALKVLHAHLAGDDTLRRRFHREARAASLLRHPAAVAIYDFGEWEGRLYIAMEFLEGQPLDELLRTEVPFAPERVVQWLVPACEVLAEAHDAGILHRDVKPSNLMVVHDPQGRETCKLVDFGLVRVQRLEGDDLALTPTHLAPGTPEYMSPEQCRGRGLDARSDLYSLGVVLYELLCGRPPFRGDSSTDVMVQHLYNDPLPPSRVRPDVPVHAGLEALALRAISKPPDDRPASARAFRQALLDAVDPQAIARAEDNARDRRLAGARGRDARAEAMGIAEAARPTAVHAEVLPEFVVAVVEPNDAAADSLAVAVRALGYAAATAPSLAAVGLGEGPLPAVVVVDVRPDPAGGLEAIRAWRDERGAAALPVVAVGPSDAMEIMARALEVGVRDYLPEGALARLLPRTLGGIVRSRLRKLQPQPGEGTP